MGNSSSTDTEVEFFRRINVLVPSQSLEPVSLVIPNYMLSEYINSLLQICFVSYGNPNLNFETRRQIPDLVVSTVFPLVDTRQLYYYDITPEIFTYIASFGRYHVSLVMYYDPDALNMVVLTRQKNNDYDVSLIQPSAIAVPDYLLPDSYYFIISACEVYASSLNISDKEKQDLIESFRSVFVDSVDPAQLIIFDYNDGLLRIMGSSNDPSNYQLVINAQAYFTKKKRNWIVLEVPDVKHHNNYPVGVIPSNSIQIVRCK